MNVSFGNLSILPLLKSPGYAFSLHAN